MSEQAGRRGKRPWNQPRLIVLVRGRGEEAVLLGCKGILGSDHFLNHYDGCHSNSPECTTLCTDIRPS